MRFEAMGCLHGSAAVEQLCCGVEGAHSLVQLGSLEDGNLCSRATTCKDSSQKAWHLGEPHHTCHKDASNCHCNGTRRTRLAAEKATKVSAMRMGASRSCAATGAPVASSAPEAARNASCTWK